MNGPVFVDGAACWDDEGTTCWDDEGTACLDDEGTACWAGLWSEFELRGTFNDLLRPSAPALLISLVCNAVLKRLEGGARFRWCLSRSAITAVVR